MSNKKTVIRIAILTSLFLIVASIVFQFFFASPPPSTAKQEITSQELDHEASAAITDETGENGVVVEKTIPKGSTFKETLAKCFPHLADAITTPKEFVENWKSLNSTAEEETDFVHYFFKDKNGQEVRAQVVYTMAEGRPIRELKLFRVLEDGLPDPIELPAPDRYNPSNTTLSKYIDFNSVFETQKKWSAKSPGSSSIEVEESNADVTEFQLFQKNTIFRCHEGDCECKAGN
ncbi:MAG: hypothetical protein JNM24_09900 [Bdellovibrionaceae bacterium]|nr:hypothetical protein [Pseudobdellovibrionaceae bacterium]